MKHFIQLKARLFELMIELDRCENLERELFLAGEYAKADEVQAVGNQLKIEIKAVSHDINFYFEIGA